MGAFWRPFCQAHYFCQSCQKVFVEKKHIFVGTPKKFLSGEKHFCQSSQNVFVGQDLFLSDNKYFCRGEKVFVRVLILLLSDKSYFCRAYMIFVCGTFFFVSQNSYKVPRAAPLEEVRFFLPFPVDVRKKREETKMSVFVKRFVE